MFTISELGYNVPLMISYLIIEDTERKWGEMFNILDVYFSPPNKVVLEKHDQNWP